MSPDTLVHLIEQYRYLILFPIACIEGPMVAFVAGTLIPLGYFNPLFLFFVLVMADVVPDVGYYGMGRFGKRASLVERLGPKIGVTPDRFDLVRRLWFGHTFKTMAITKFAYGLSTPLLISAGLVHLPFRKFWTSTIPLSMLQYSVLLTLGYFFGSSYSLVESTLTRVEMVVAAAVIIGGLYYYFTNKVRTTFLAAQKKEEKEI